MKSFKKSLLCAFVLMLASSMSLFVITANAKATAQTNRELCTYLSDDFEGSRGVRSTDNLSGSSPFDATPFWSDNDSLWLITSDSSEIISGNQSLKIPLNAAGSHIAVGFKNSVALPDVIPGGQVIGISFKVKLVNSTNITMTYNWGDIWHGDLLINADASYVVNIPDMQADSLEISKQDDVITVSLGIILYSSNGKINIFATPEDGKQVSGGDGTAFIIMDDFIINEEHNTKQEYFKNVFSSTFDNANDTDTPANDADKLFQTYGFDKGYINEFNYIDSEINLGKALKLISPVADWTTSLSLYSSGYTLENYSHYKYSVVMKTDNMYKLAIKLYGNNAIQKEVYIDTTYYARNASNETDYIDNNKSVNDYVNFEPLDNGYMRLTFDFYTENWSDMYIKWDNHFISASGSMIIDEVKIDKQFFEPIISEGDKSFNPVKNDDLVIGVNMNIGELDNIKFNLNDTLTDMVLDIDYTYANDILTVKNAFLKAQNLTVDDVCKINITNVYYGISYGLTEVEFDIIDSKPVIEASAIYDKATPLDVVFNVDLQNETITSFKLGEQDINYTYSEGKITIAENIVTALNLTYGENNFILTTSGGTSDATLIYKATPSIIINDYDMASNEDFSFTIATLNEAITELKINDTILTTNDYTINENIITINKSNLIIGNTTFTLTTAGGKAEKIIAITDTTVEISSEDTEFLRGTDEEITITLSAKGKAVTSVKLNNEILTDNDMILSSNSVTILNTKLSTLNAGEYQLIVTTESSSDSILISVKAKVPAVSGDITKTINLANVTDTSFTIDTDGQSIIVKTGGIEISANNYTFADNTLTFKKSYIETLTGTEVGKDYIFEVSTNSGEVTLTLKLKSEIISDNEDITSGCGSTGFNGFNSGILIISLISIILLIIKNKRSNQV